MINVHCSLGKPQSPLSPHGRGRAQGFHHARWISRDTAGRTWQAPSSLIIVNCSLVIVKVQFAARRGTSLADFTPGVTCETLAVLAWHHHQRDFSVHRPAGLKIRGSVGLSPLGQLFVADPGDCYLLCGRRCPHLAVGLSVAASQAHPRQATVPGGRHRLYGQQYLPLPHWRAAARLRAEARRRCEHQLVTGNDCGGAHLRRPDDAALRCHRSAHSAVPVRCAASGGTARQA